MVTGIAAFFYALDPDEYQIAGALYTFSYALDALDGVAARKLNQCACSMQHPFSLSVCYPSARSSGGAYHALGAITCDSGLPLSASVCEWALPWCGAGEGAKGGLFRGVVARTPTKFSANVRACAPRAGSRLGAVLDMITDRYVR